MRVPENTRTKVSLRERAPRNVSSVIIVRAREAFRGNGNNSRFESSTSLSAFDERAHARSLCTRIDLSATMWGRGPRGGIQESSDREGPADHKCTESSAPDFPHHELVGVGVYVCVRAFTWVGWKEVGGWSLSLSLQISTGETETLNEIIS